MNFAMINGILSKVTDMIVGFAAIIPQFMYFCYASLASLIDVFQFVFKKIVGLDTYYVQNSVTGNFEEKTGDILSELLEGIVGINNNYSALAVVFWAMFVFGIIVLVLSTIFTIIKAHYNYDAEKSHPMKIISTAIKSLFTMAITPVVIILSITVLNLLLSTLNDITSSSYAVNVDGIYESEVVDKFDSGKELKIITDEDGNEKRVVANEFYSSYNMFAHEEYTSNTTFSGMIFSTMMNSANRVRLGSYSAEVSASNDNWDNCQILYVNDAVDPKTEIANQIDFAFANSLRLKNDVDVDFVGYDEAFFAMGSSLTNSISIVFARGLVNVDCFSKFNVGLVWYFYNLWLANFIIGFAAGGTIFFLMINIIFGMFKRLLICSALFLVYSPLVGLSPFDGGQGFSSWKNEFIKYYIASFGAVLGINLFFLIVPVLQGISFFNNFLLDGIFNIVLVICGIIMIKKFISLVSAFVGGADLNAEGESLKGEVGALALNTASAMLAVGGVGAAGIKAFNLKGGGLVKKAGSSVGDKVKGGMNKLKNNKIDNFMSSLNETQKTDLEAFIKKDGTDQGIKNYVASKPYGLSKKQTKLLPKDHKFVKGAGSGIVKFGKGTASVAKNIRNKVKLAHQWYKEDDEVEEVDEEVDVDTNENVAATKKKPSVAKKIVRGMVDLTGTTLRAVGEATFVNKGIDNLNSKGLGDEFKGFVQMATDAVGISSVTDKAKTGDSYWSTGKQKEKASDSADERAKDLESINRATQDAIDALKEINKNIT